MPSLNSWRWKTGIVKHSKHLNAGGIAVTTLKYEQGGFPEEFASKKHNDAS